MDQAKLQNILSELRAKLPALYGERLSKVMLYGSQARGDATEGSDIDVMVVLRDEPTKAEDEMKLNLACELSFKYDTLVSLLLVSQERFRLGGSPLLINVRREGVSV